MTAQSPTYGAQAPVVTDDPQQLATACQDMETLELMKMSTEESMDASLKHDPDYRAAWRACRPLPQLDPNRYHYSETRVRMREWLAAALRTGWSMAALKASAWNYRTAGCDHVTPAAWRYAVLFYSTDRKFLERFNTHPECRSYYDAHVK